MASLLRASVRSVRPLAGRRMASGGTHFSKDAAVAEQQKTFQANGHLHGADNPTYLKGGTMDK